MQPGLEDLTTEDLTSQPGLEDLEGPGLFTVSEFANTLCLA